MNKKYICNICNKYLINIKIELPLFTHFNFSLLQKKAIYNFCTNCNIIINKNLSSKKINFIKSKKYSKLNVTQKNFNKKQNLQKHDEQFIYLKKNLLIPKGVKVLDIGCNKGFLIKKIEQKINNSICKGYDENPYIQNYLKKKGFLLNYEKNKKIKFDLIVLSHSLMYFKNIKKLIKFLDNNLSKDGKIFIESPNIEKSPFYLLMGDQYYFFSIYALKKIFYKFNFHLSSVNNSPESSNFSVIFEKKKYKNHHIKKFNLNKSLKYLNFLKNYLLSLKKKNIYIFGTTVKAAFIHHFIKKNVSFFIDEENKNNYFNRIKVKHPNILKRKNFVLVPLKEKKNILKKLKSKYLGTFKMI